jgi:hypothetical protein
VWPRESLRDRRGDRQRRHLLHGALATAPSGAAVGCAYFGFLDTDLVRAAFAEPSAQAMTGRLPGFIRNPAPLSKAIDAIGPYLASSPVACGSPSARIR